jgi:hypothetical protein
MVIGDFRDIVIIVTGIIEIILLITFVVVVLLIYNKLKPILKDIEEITAATRKVTTYIASGIGNPAVQIFALVNGIRKGIEAISKAFRRKKADHGD